MENINISPLKNPLTKPFNYAEYVKNPLRKVITRNGYKVKSIKFSPEEDTYPIMITYELGDGSIGTGTCTKTGREWKDEESNDLDIFFDDRADAESEAKSSDTPEAAIENALKEESVNGRKCMAEKEAETFKRKYPAVWQKYKNEDWNILELLEFAYEQGMLKGKSLVEHGKLLQEKLDESTYLKIKREDFEELRSQKDSLMAKVAEIGLELQDCEKANKELRKKISSDNRLIEPTDKELFDILAKRGYFGTLKLCTEVHIGNIGNVDSKKYIYENKTPEETPEGSI